jgi:cell wall-associated NlpC family hydrolase
LISPSEVSDRARVVCIARSFLGTPYHSHGRKKGVGVDCLTLLAEVYTEAGLIEPVKLPHYAPDFFKHKGTELYLNGLLQYTAEVETGKPGDIVLWKYGRCFSHGAIVVDWPHIIHAHVGRSCMLESIDAAVWLKFIGENTPDHGKLRPMKIFSFWAHNGLPVRQSKE